MKMQEQLTNFFKDQTSAHRNPITDTAEFIGKYHKPIIATIAGTGIILSFVPNKELFGDEKNTPCPSPIASKLLGTSEKSNFESGLKKLLLNKTEKFFQITIPYSRPDGFSKDQWANTDTNVLAEKILKNKNEIPQLLENDDTSANYPGNAKDKYEKVIIESEKKNQSLGTFSANLEGKKVSVEFKPNQDIGNNDLTLEAYVYRNWVNIDPPNKNGQVHHDRILIELPLGVDGKKIKPNKDGLIEESFDIKRLTEQYKNQEGVLMVIKRKSITIGTGSFEFAKAQGIDQPAYFNWNNWPNATVDIKSPNSPPIKEYTKETALGEMKFSVKDAKDIKKLSFQIDRTKNEIDFYDILAAVINPNLKGADFKVDIEKQKIDINFDQAINGDIDLFKFITHFKKEDVTVSRSFKVKNFSATDSKGNTVYFDINDIAQYFPVQLNIAENPLDLDHDSWINNEDLDLLIGVFGTQEGDKNWKPEYDIYKEGVSEGRIDIGDVLVMLKAVEEQDKLIAEIKAANPDAILPEMSIDVEKILAPIQLTGNQFIDERAVRTWLQKRDIYKETFEKVKEVRKAGVLTAV